VQIERHDALTVIRRFDGPATLTYTDPPYPAATHSARWRAAAHTHELTDDDHRRLADVLRAVGGMAVVSGRRCALYDELYGDWIRVEHRARTLAAMLATECLWLSPRAAARLPARQLALEELPGG
jgi:DNA adenine methylase